MSLKEGAQHLLQEAGEPLHYQELTKRLLDKGLVESQSKTPAASLNAVLAVDIKRKGKDSAFVRVSPGVFGLRAQGAPEQSVEETTEDPERRVRIPHFPPYSEVRLVLPVWSGMQRSAVTGLRSTIAMLRGTPQEPVDWSSPDDWIPERLSGSDRETALAVWTGTSKQVNPRHVYGHWLLATHYSLLADDDGGALQLTERGKDFLESPGGKTEAALDQAEGLQKLLALVGDVGPASFGELVEGWGEYLSRRSKFGTDSTIKDTLRRRLRNLLDRKLLDRSSTQYSISDVGLAYLGQTGDEDAPGGEEDQEIRKLVRHQESSVRESIRDILADLDPFAFEHLVKRLLEEMTYDNVEVTSRSGDGGIDVVADIELGITSVREVVQAKRHKRTIQRKDLDALRGSLHRFGAVRGTIIATSKYSKGTRDAAFEPGAAPITLIDGEKLIDLLITHGIGVRKKTLEVLDLNASAFAEVEESLSENGGDQ
ncbi:MAG: restriction endonuclease [Proteobacteria bacterium]|nr:MAG: restriction endonuclease [Pseudomonadota bacterium]